jgi:hypothetical protein
MQKEMKEMQEQMQEQHTEICTKLLAALKLLMRTTASMERRGGGLGS